MKTLILWQRKRTTTPKTQGAATAPHAVATIDSLARSALEGRGILWIVDAPNARAARIAIDAWREGALPAMSACVGENPRPQRTFGAIVALGVNACVALNLASAVRRASDANPTLTFATLERLGADRLQRDGSSMEFLNPADACGAAWTHH